MMTTPHAQPAPTPPLRELPPVDEMLDAFMTRDAQYDGIFVTAVKTTGIFCRPSCPARKPKRENVEFHASSSDALAAGFRPCKRCRPMEPADETPEAIRGLIADLDADPSLRLRDGDLRARGLEPRTVRRWFQAHHGMTFHAYQRGRRLAQALHQLGDGAPILDTALESGYESLSGFHEAIQRITGATPSASRDVPLVHLTRVTTPLGPMLLGATDEGVCLLEFTDRRMLETQLRRLVKRLGCAFVPGPNGLTRRLEDELTRYFDGTLETFETPLLTPGTDFQQRVWTALQSIPYGATRSYAEQARMIDSPKAVRAVARANGDNRIAIVIPCHRVIGADGSLTGYGGGLWRKKWLLHHEGVTDASADQLTLPT